MGHPVRIDSRGVRREVRDAILRRGREPMVELLALFLTMAPSQEAFEEMARRDPGKWIKSIVLLADLVGYAERRQVDVGMTIDVGAMSDSQLEAALAARVARLGLVAGADRAGAKGSGLLQLWAQETSA